MKKNNRLFVLVSFLVMAFVAFGQTGGGIPSDYVDDVGSPGAQCAVKKAYQMTDVEFVPLDTLIANTKRTYLPGENYKGLIYSFTSKTSCFVGYDVSFHTFLTAIHNPRSVLYTESITKRPCHGKTVAAYYGTFCSALVSYALGFSAYRRTYEFPSSDDMFLIEDQSATGVQLADVMWRSGHVAIVTGIKRNSKTDAVVSVEFCEAIDNGCRRVVKSAKEFNQRFSGGQWKIFRYKDLEKNTYTPETEFVAVDDEQLTPFKYNDALCPNKGDKSCYITGDSVVLNILGKGFDNATIYKDSKKYNTVAINGDSDIVLKDLPYGNYKAMLERKGEKTDFVYWKVVDVRVDTNKKDDIITFQSYNAAPMYLEFCTITGFRPEWAWYAFNEDDVSKGFVKISDLPLSDILKEQEEALYARVHFDCDYGRVMNNPILWKKKTNTKSK